MLSVKNIQVFYGSSHIIFGASFNVKEKEIVCLLGRNGVGKTTTLRSIIGLTPPKTGLIEFEGLEITKEPPYDRARRGIGYVPENRGLFPRLTVHENLKMAEIGSRVPNGIERAMEVFPILKEYLSTNAENLSGGEQQMLAIGRSLVGNSRLLLLDECSQGLAPKILDHLKESIIAIKKNTAILLVEQNVRFALDVSDRCYVMRDGRIVFEGSPNEVLENKKVQEYLVVTE